LHALEFGGRRGGQEQAEGHSQQGIDGHVQANTSSTKPDAINAWTATMSERKRGSAVCSSRWSSPGSLMVGGMVVGNLTGRPLRRSGRRQLALGAVAVAVSYGIGHLIGSPIS
jgi:hypothetical protein